MPDFKSKKSIIHIMEWIAAIIVAVAVADMFCFDCGKHEVKNQFICGVVYGYLIVTTLIFFGLCVDEEVSEKMGYALTGLGASLYLVVAILFVIYFDDYESTLQEGPYACLILAMVFAFFNFVLFCVEFFLSLFKKDLLE